MPRPRRWEPNGRLVYERERRGWSQEDAAREADQVADRLGLLGLAFVGAQFGRWERGECRPRPPLLRVVCELYKASAEELGLCERPPSMVSSADAMLSAAGRIGAVLSPPAAAQEAEPRTANQEVATTNRREAIKHAIVVGAGIVVEGRMLADAADASVVASRRWSASSVNAMTLETLDQDVERFASIYHGTPHAQLFPAVWEDWLQVERLLDGRQSLKDRAHLTLLGGQLTYFLARLSFHMGDHAAARKHAVLAWRHAEDVGQPVLCGSVKALQSSIAFYAGQYQKALDLLQAAEPYVVPYTHARLAAYAMRVHAMLGDQPSAEAARRRMERHLVQLPVEPGESPFSAATAMMFTAGVYARLGNGVTAEEYSHQALAWYDAPQLQGTMFADRGHARLNLAASLLARSRPDPEEAAQLAASALSVPAPQRNDTVRRRAVELWELLADWRTTPAVQDFGERLRAYTPPALPTSIG